MLFHNDFSPSGEPEPRILPHKLLQPIAGCIAIFHKYCCYTKRGGIITNLTAKSLGYNTDVSNYHNTGIWSMDKDISHFYVQKHIAPQARCESTASSRQAARGLRIYETRPVKMCLVLRGLRISVGLRLLCLKNIVQSSKTYAKSSMYSESWKNKITYHFAWLVQEIRYSIAKALELRLSCTNPAICRRYLSYWWLRIVMWSGYIMCIDHVSVSYIQTERLVKGCNAGCPYKMSVLRHIQMHFLKENCFI